MCDRDYMTNPIIFTTWLFTENVRRPIFILKYTPIFIDTLFRTETSLWSEAT